MTGPRTGSSSREVRFTTVGLALLASLIALNVAYLAAFGREGPAAAALVGVR